MSAIATMSPSHNVGGPGWCSTRDIRKSRETATEHRTASIFVTFAISFSAGAQLRNSAYVTDSHAGRLRARPTLFSPEQLIVLKKWKLVGDPGPGRRPSEGGPIGGHVRLVGISDR